MSIRFAIPIVMATYILAVCGRQALAQTFSINPVADAFVFAAEPDGNYGGAGIFAVSAPLPPNGEFQSLLRFDLSGAKSSFDLTFGAGNWFLQSAILQLSAASPNNPIFNASAAGQFHATWLQNDSWVEGTGTPTSPGTTGITWSTLPSILSASDQDLGTFAFNGSTTATSTYSLGLPSGLVGDVATGGLASIRLRAAAGDATMSGVFNSRSFSTATRRPLLTLNAAVVPEPATWILAVCGVVGLGFVRSGNRRLKRGSSDRG